MFFAVRIPDPAADDVQVHIFASRRGPATVRQVRRAVHPELQVPGRVAHVQVRATTRGDHRTGGRGGADQLAQVRAQVRAELVQTGTATAATGVRAAGRAVQVHRGAVVQVRATGHGARVRPSPAAGRGRVLRLHRRQATVLMTQPSAADIPSAAHPRLGPTTVHAHHAPMRVIYNNTRVARTPLLFVPRHVL